MLATPTRQLIPFACATAIVCLSTTAWAQVDAAKKAAADKLYTKGVKAVISGDYPSAIIHFQNGYNIDPDPKFLYNVSVCYGRLKNYEKAITFARRVVGSGRANAGLQSKAKGRLRAFQAMMAAKGTADAFKNNPIVIKQPDKKPATKGGFGTVGWIGVATTGVGAALLATAVIYSAGLGDDITAYEDGVRTDPNPSRDQQRFDDLQSRQSTGKLFVYSGAGLAVVGIGLIAYELASGGDTPPPADASTARLNVAPILSPRAQGGVMTLTFGF